MNILLKLLGIGVLTADLDIDTVGPTELVHGVGGTGDTLFKGAMVAIGVDGYIVVPTDITDLVPLGVMKKQVVVAGSNAENFEVVTGKLWIPYSSAAIEQVGQLKYCTDDATLASSATNIKALGLCVDFKTGYLLIDTKIKSITA